MHFLFLLAFALVLANNHSLQAAGSEPNHFSYLQAPKALETKSNFSETWETQKTPLPFENDYLDDWDLEIGEEKIVTAGIAGEEIKVFKVTSWQGKEVGRTLDSKKIIPAVKQKVRRGRKIIWKEITTANQGLLKYWQKLNVWATSYDGRCHGCLGRTYSGTEVIVGTCAVDPKVIVLGSHFYVPGYGVCSALDIGGAIKGNKIDLGFPDVSKGFWSARFTDIYLLDGPPKSE